jgi:predicted nucleotidyltransferase
MPHIGEVTLPLLGCYRCAHEWSPKTPIVRLCPRCKSRLWDTPRAPKSIGKSAGPDLRGVIGPNRREIRRLAREYQANRPRIFGSVARGQANSCSDVDIVVSFTDQATLFDHIRLRRALSKLLQRKVDVVDEDGLHWFSKPEILREAVPV